MGKHSLFTEAHSRYTYMYGMFHQGYGAQPTGKGSQLPQTAAAQLLKANELREEGNKLFEGQNFRGALRKYHNALLYARAVANKLSGDLSGLMNRAQHATAAEEESAKKLTIALSNNLAGLCMHISCHR